jgi:hypothetical protein
VFRALSVTSRIASRSLSANRLSAVSSSSSWSSPYAQVRRSFASDEKKKSEGNDSVRSVANFSWIQLDS